MEVGGRSGGRGGGREGGIVLGDLPLGLRRPEIPDSNRVKGAKIS